MPKTAGGWLGAGEEEAEMATVDPNGSKCAAVPITHLQRSTSCVTVGILERPRFLPGASGLDGLAGKTDGRI